MNHRGTETQRTASRKTFYLFSLCLCVSVVKYVPVGAEDAPPVQVVGTTHRSERPDAAEETERYARSLKLDAKQKAGVARILIQAQKDRERFEAAQASFQRRMMELQRAIRDLDAAFREETRKEEAAQARRLDAIRALLTPEQRARLDKIEESRAREADEIRRKDQEEAQRGKDPLPSDGAPGRAP